MISVLIPVFNCVVVDLVAKLNKQLIETRVPFEILILDDNSPLSIKKFNRALCEYEKVEYSELPQNIGRIAIRNVLAKKAAFNWLLFLDADSIIIENNFITSYLNAIRTDSCVIVGGRVYKLDKPSECQLNLHWTYGSHREQQTPEQRQTQPHAGFMSNNFLIRNDVFQKLQITEVLSGYGHEDTWMGIQLEEIGVSVLHIANPVLHNGLEESQVFMEKSLNALKNLNLLQKVVRNEVLIHHVKLYATFCRFKKLGMLPVLNLVFSIMQLFILKNLHSCRPSLFLFDIYRLNYFISLNKKS